MSTTAALHSRPVLADLVPGARARDASLVLAGAGLAGLAAQVSIHTPMSPVPFTLQTMAVLVVGASLGPVRGATSMVVYALAGGVGVPWFANQSHGFGGPAFGYILGFIAAAVITGSLAKRGADRHVIGTVALMALGTAVIYVVGTAWLAHALDLSPTAAFDLGVRPFVAADALKVAVAAIAFPAAWKLTRR